MYRVALASAGLAKIAEVEAARIGLNDDPQMMESPGIVVKRYSQVTARTRRTLKR